eukprot:321608-Hanusia_phi.AAC.1
MTASTGEERRRRTGRMAAASDADAGAGERWKEGYPWRRANRFRQLRARRLVAAAEKRAGIRGEGREGTGDQESLTQEKSQPPLPPPSPPSPRSDLN